MDEREEYKNPDYDQWPMELTAQQAVVAMACDMLVKAVNEEPFYSDPVKHARQIQVVFDLRCSRNRAV